MLAGIYYGAQYGGSTTAILVNMPGESSSVVTCLDGHQMARTGPRRRALAIAALGSFFAGTVATVVIAASRRRCSRVALKFGAAEYFALMVLGLIGAVVLAHGSPLKAIAMVVLGLLLGLVGTDVNSGVAALHLRHSRSSPTASASCRRHGPVRLRRDHRAISSSRRTAARDHAQGLRNLWPTRGESRQRLAGRCCAAPALGSILGVLPGGGAVLAVVRLLRAGEEDRRATRRASARARSRASPARKSANNAGAQTVLHSAAHARHSVQRRDGADDRRA